LETFEEQILGMSEAELDALPQGIIRLDASGKILYYNKAQAGFAHRSASAIGLNFFNDVAPCTAVRDFQGRFIDFLSTPGSRIEPFAFLFRFDWGSKWATITMVRQADAEHGVYMVITTSPAPP
jgi:photoactive yellow protein